MRLQWRIIAGAIFVAGVAALVLNVFAGSVTSAVWGAGLALWGVALFKIADRLPPIHQLPISFVTVASAMTGGLVLVIVFIVVAVDPVDWTARVCSLFGVVFVIGINAFLINRFLSTRRMN
jgi:hypothetical protein